MRVGMAFSAVLTPSKDPLFSELGNLDLTTAEAWHSSCNTSTLGAQQNPSKTTPIQ